MVEVYTTTEVDSQVNDLATTLNAQIATLAQSVEALEARVVALEAIEPPPPDPDPDPPPPDPDPGPGPTPPDDAIQVDPGDSIPAAITKAAAEKRDVWLVNGTHQLGQPLDGLANIKMLSDGAILRGSGPGGHHLVKEGGPMYWEGIEIIRFGPHEKKSNGAALQSGAMILGGTRHFHNVSFRETNGTVMRMGKKWQVSGDMEVSDIGRYLFAGGPGENATEADKVVISANINATRIALDNNEMEGGVERPGTHPDDQNPTDRGFCKIARQSWVHFTGKVIIDNARQGIWYDIANTNGYIKYLECYNIRRSGINLEAGYGGFVIDYFKGRNCGMSPYANSEPANYPGPGAISISFTNNILIKEVDIDTSLNGIGFLNPAAHTQWTNTQNDVTRMGVQNVTIQSGRMGSDIERWHIGMAGSAHKQTFQGQKPLQPTGLVWSGVTLPAGAKIDTTW